jgi:hypothetical protein
MADNGRLRPYVPLVPSGHLLTMAGHYWPRRLDTTRFPVEAMRYATAPDAEVLVEHQRPAGPARAQLVLVHGLES